MTCNLADLDSEVLLTIAQHLILASSTSLTAEDLDSELYNPGSSSKNALSRYPPSTASSSRTDINSLLNSSTTNSNVTRYRSLSGNISASQQSSSSSRSTRPRPVFLLPLLLTCKKIYASLSIEGNPRLYCWLYEATFDTAAIKRRWTRTTIPSWHFNEHTTGYPDTGADDNHRSKRQRLDGRRHISPTVSRSSISNESFDVGSNPSFLAEEYRERFWMFSRFRALHLRYADAGILDQKAETLNSQLTSDLWMIWFMITEHGEFERSEVSMSSWINTGCQSTFSDEKNIPIILELVCLDNRLDFLYQKVYLEDALSPGLPPSTTIKALTAWIIVRLGLSATLENSPEEVDEKVFALAPFALASFKVSTLANIRRV